MQAFIAGLRQRGHWSEQHVAAAAAALLAAGADHSGRSSVGLTPLDFAASCQHPAAAQVCIGALLAAGADPNAPNSMGERPLYSAAANGSSCAAHDAIVALLAGGADPLGGGGGGGPVTALHGLAENEDFWAARMAASVLADAVAARWQAALAAWHDEHAELTARHLRETEEVGAALRREHAAREARLVRDRDHLRESNERLEARLSITAGQLRAGAAERQQAAACVVCQRAPRTRALTCGHFCLCGECAAATAAAGNRCPICSKKSRTALTILM